MRIIYNRIIPFGKRFHAVNLFGVLFAKGRCTDWMINHESIHTAQMKELLFIFFYILYIVEGIYRIIRYRGVMAGYYNISFEREAYASQNDPLYLRHRKPFAFLRHLTPL